MLIAILSPYILTFIPIFLAIDVFGTIPLYLSLTEKLTGKQRSRVLVESIIIATVFAVIFALLGKVILRALGITIDDFRIAGGVLLFILSVHLLLPGHSRGFIQESLSEDIGIFPLATPLITGPAVLVTTIMLIDNFGRHVTLTSLILNMLLTWGTLKASEKLGRIFGPSGVKAFSKITYIFLAAIAIMIIRVGLGNTIDLFVHHGP
jgi:multiple antibiotic resistance protein